MTPPAVELRDRPRLRPPMAGLAAIALLATTFGAPPAVEAAPSSGAAAKAHSCCCGPSCRSEKCCCLLPGKPARAPRPDPAPTLPAEADAEAQIDPGDVLPIDPTPCIGRLPCGGDQEGTISLLSPRDRPATVPGRAWISTRPGRPPLPRFVDPFCSRLPADLPHEPPERSRLGLLAPR